MPDVVPILLDGGLQLADGLIQLVHRPLADAQVLEVKDAHVLWQMLMSWQ